MGKTMVKSNRTQIDQLIGFLNTWNVPSDFSARLQPAIQADQETALLAFFWAAAICHSTKGGLLAIKNGQAIKGFDVLLEAFTRAANTTPREIQLDRFERIQGPELKAFLENHLDQAVITLPDLDRRAEILRTLVQELKTHFDGQLSTLFEQTGGRLAGDHGFYALMRKFSIFQDEQAKKSSVFLHCLGQAERWQPIDPDNALPMVDYHIIRLFCRTGCLEIEDQTLAEKLRTKQEVTVEEEQAIRDMARDIRVLISRELTSPLRGELLYYFARSYCRNRPVCVPGNLPESHSFNHVTNTNFTGSCPLQNWCHGCRDTSYRDFWEPLIQTENY